MWEFLGKFLILISLKNFIEYLNIRLYLDNRIIIIKRNFKIKNLI